MMCFPIFVNNLQSSMQRIWQKIFDIKSKNKLDGNDKNIPRHFTEGYYNVQYKLIKVTIIRYLMLKSNDKNSILYVGINDKLLSIHLNNCLFVSAFQSNNI